MKTKHKIVIPTEVIIVTTGSRDAVESAIDLAKDGAPWESQQQRIKPWPVRLGEDRERCPSDALSKRR